jgi:hypothetical protein
MPRFHSAPLLLLLVLSFAETVAAQESRTPTQGSSATQARVAVPGVRRGDIVIDGQIDEAAWMAEPVITDFVASEPQEGEPSGERTEVRILMDDQAIWVSARLYESDPSDVRSLLLRRDQRGAFFDWFGVSLDPNHDRRSGYAFRVNAAGVQQDLYMFDDTGEDTNWNAVWASAVTVDSLGWSVEVRIPLSQIRYESSEGPQTWGVNFHRRRVAAGELSHFSLESRRRAGLVSQFGTLANVHVPATVRRIEARPYILSSFHKGPSAINDPFFDGSDGGGGAGVDFRLGLGSAFTLDGTANPDFGQVEADPAEINLTAFETFFDERRPFFVEDAQIFDFGLSGGRNQLFYSRRVGRAPHESAPDDALAAEVPGAATILAAAKLTGRTNRGLSVGVLTAMTQAETGRALFEGSDQIQTFRAEPRAEYGAFSAFQDLNEGRTKVGGLVTVLTRGLPATGEFDGLTDQAFSGGVRFEHQWDDRQWQLNGFLAGSRVGGDPAALLAIQRSSNHYFQRPDGTRAILDSAATTLSGAEWRLQLDRQNTRRWTGSVWLAEVTKGFEINDLGFSNSLERLDGGFRVGYREIDPGDLFREYRVTFSSFHNFSHEALDDIASLDSWRRAYTNGSFGLDSNFTFLNFHAITLGATLAPDRYSRTATRGGPVMIDPGNTDWRVRLNSDRRRNLSVNLGMNYTKGAQGSGDQVSINTTANLRPSTALSIQLSPRYTVQTDATQYVTSTSILAYAPTFGRRYLFGEIERKTATLETRIDYTFSPSLSFQLYAQGLLSSGDYVRYRQLTQAATYDFEEFWEGRAVEVGGAVSCEGGTICQDAGGTQHVDFDGDGASDFTFADRDFNARSLVGNAVVRWEYRPGSTVFLVWQRQQSARAALSDFDFGRDVDALWALPADNRFILKVNIWLGL